MDNEKINPELEDATGLDAEAELDMQGAENENSSTEPQNTEDGDPELVEGDGENESVTEASEAKTKRTLLSVIEFVELFATATVAVLLIFTFIFRVCTVDGDSMLNTLHNNETLIISKLFYTPESGDIVVFYEDTDGLQRPLIKRVIATEGQTIEINYYNGTVKVDGELLCEDYVYLEGGSYIIHSKYEVDPATGTMTMTVPENELFVMGDNRNNSWDSRSRDIGCVSENQIIGHAIFRIAPFKIFN